MFNVGDRVVYPMYGAGVIEGIETRDVDGQELSYYVLHIPIGDLKILISKSKADVLGLRALNSAEEVIDIVNNALLAVLPVRAFIPSAISRKTS